MGVVTHHSAHVTYTITHQGQFKDAGGTLEYLEDTCEAQEETRVRMGIKLTHPEIRVKLDQQKCSFYKPGNMVNTRLYSVD